MVDTAGHLQGTAASGKRKKMAGNKKEKAAPSIAASTRSVSEAESDTPSPVAKKKSELQETIAANATHVKEALKVKMRSGSSEDTSVPPSQLHPKFWVKKKSTL